MLSSAAHASAAPSRPRPPGAGRRGRSSGATATQAASQNNPPHAPQHQYTAPGALELPTDALASSITARATTLPAVGLSPDAGRTISAASAGSLPPSPSPHSRTLQPTRSRLLNVFSTSTDNSSGGGAGQWSDDSRPGTPKPLRTPAKMPPAPLVSSPATDEQFSALVNVALANMASRRASAGKQSSGSAGTTVGGGASSHDTLHPLSHLSGSELDTDHIGGLSRSELEELLVAANRKIMERERDIAIAAQIGRTLVEKHDSIKAKHDGILRAIASSNGVLRVPVLEDELEHGPPRYTPPSNDSHDYFGTPHSVQQHHHLHLHDVPQQQQQQHAHHHQHPAASSPLSAFADTSFERRSTDSGGSSSRMSHKRSMGSAAAAYMQAQLEELEVRNDDLYIEVDALRTKAEADKKRDSERLRGIQREMEALKTELSLAYSRNAELEEVARLEDERRARYGTEAWKKRVAGGAGDAAKAQWWNEATATPSPIKIVLQRPPNARMDSNELSNDDGAGLSSADVSLDSLQSGGRQRLDDEQAGARDNEEEDDDDDSATHRAHSRLPSRDDIADAAAADYERALVAQLLAKVRELEEANAAISARAKEFGEKAGRAFEQGERIRDGYAAVESASRMDLAAAAAGSGEREDAEDEGGEDGQGDLSYASAGAGAAGDSSFSMRSVSGGSGGAGLVIRRRAPGNRYAIEGRRTLRSAIRREKAALAELIAARAPETSMVSSGSGNATIMPNSTSISSISSFTSSLGSLRASSSESSFNHSRESARSAAAAAAAARQHQQHQLKGRKSSSLLLGRPKIRITPSCEDMAAAREEAARQQAGGWEDLSDMGHSGGGHSTGAEAAAREEEAGDGLLPLAHHVRRAGLPSSRSLRRIASDGGLLAQQPPPQHQQDSDTDGSPFTSRRRTARRPMRARAPPQITPSSSFNSVQFPSSGVGLSAQALGATTLGSELGSEFGAEDRYDDDDEDSSSVGGQRLAIGPPSSISSATTTTSGSHAPLKYRRPRRVQSTANLTVATSTDDEDALSDIAELRFSINGATNPYADSTISANNSIMPASSSLEQELALAGTGPIDRRLSLTCSPASDGVWRGEGPVLPRGALRDGEMTQYAAYDLLERAADQHPVHWADDEDFGRPITEGEARRLKLLEEPPRAAKTRVGGGLLGWLQPTPRRQTRKSIVGGAGTSSAVAAAAAAAPPTIMGEIESQEQIEERQRISVLLRHKRLAALQRAASARRGHGYDLSPSRQQQLRRGIDGGEADGDGDDEDAEEDEIEARALAFSPSRQRRVNRLSMHGMPPSGEELLIPGAIRKRRSFSKLREGGDERRREGDASRLRPSRNGSSNSVSVRSVASSYDGEQGAGPSTRRRRGEADDEEEEENFELIEVPQAVRRQRSTAGTDYYPVDLYARYQPSMVQSRVKVASSEVVTLISTWALFATVTVFAFVVAFSRGPRRVLGTSSGPVVHARRTA